MNKDTNMTPSPSHDPSTSGKGKAFFDRADEVAETGNWDFAIEMYLEGIAREPGNIDRGHKPLRDVSLQRKVQGGRGPGIVEKVKRGASKDPLVSLVNAEHLLAKEPGSAEFMVRVLTAARKLDLPDVVRWICDILMEVQRQSPKPDKRILMKVTEAYDAIEEYASAMQACEMARQLTPNDNQLAQAMQELTAKYTIQKGRYDQEGDFVKGVKDMDRQKELAQKDALVKDEQFLIQQIDLTRKEYLDSPGVPGKVNALVDALLKFEDEAYENEAIDVLAKAHKDTGAYQFKMRIGDVKIRQMNRRSRKLMAQADKDIVEQALREQLVFELEEYTERAANYPTDMAIKYELGRRQCVAGRLDEAIASLQQASRDPRRHVRALSYLGQAFARKQWFQEAADTYDRALQSEMTEDLAKDIRYSLGDIYEKMNDLKKAQDQFSDVAQMDYQYKDVRQRLEAIRRKISESQGG